MLPLFLKLLLVKWDDWVGEVSTINEVVGLGSGLVTLTTTSGGLFLFFSAKASSMNKTLSAISISGFIMSVFRLSVTRTSPVIKIDDGQIRITAIINIS